MLAAELRVRVKCFLDYWLFRTWNWIRGLFKV
jgi:hypothetical protein